MHAEEDSPPRSTGADEERKAGGEHAGEGQERKAPRRCQGIARGEEAKGACAVERGPPQEHDRRRRCC